MAYKLTSLSRSLFSSLCRINCNIPSFNNYMINASNIATTPVESTDLKWEICVATCIVRPPVLTCSMSHMEQKYSDLIQKLEFRDAMKNDHELKLEEDSLKAELIKSGVHTGLEEASVQTAVEYEDACKEELTSFKLASRKTDADEQSDLTSCWRELDRSLILTVNQLLGSDSQWILPQTAWIPGESLRQTAERVAKSICGNEFPVRFFGNEPCGFYKYKYSKGDRKKGFIGAKVFFYRGFASNPTRQTSSTREDIKEYLWLTHEQLSDRMKPQYLKAFNQFVIHDQ